MSRISVIGGGSWGTALAVIAAGGGHDVTLWSRDAEVVGAINAERRNPKYLSDLDIPLSVHATLNLSNNRKPGPVDYPRSTFTRNSRIDGTDRRRSIT